MKPPGVKAINDAQRADIASFTYEGEEILVTMAGGPDEYECSSESPSGWSCSRLKNHDGKHIACCYDERIGLPDEVWAVW